MEYPDQADVLEADPLLPWIDRQFLRGDPFAFAGGDFRRIVADAVRAFDVDANGIYCVGSGATGLSLSPEKIVGQALKKFDDESDIDMAIISEFHFESAWRDLRRAAQPSLETVPKVIQENLAWQKKRFFDGAILTHKLLSALSFGPTWAGGLPRVEQEIATQLGREVPVNIWVFRDYWSLRNYVSDSIVKCRKVLV